jgi:hypothetical protein
MHMTLICHWPLYLLTRASPQGRRLAEGALVREHILKIIATFEEAKVLGTIIDFESQVDMVLEILQDSFSQFKLNYNINKLELTLMELMKKFQIEEKVMTPQSKALAIKSSSSRIEPKPRKFKKKKGNIIAQPKS